MTLKLMVRKLHLNKSKFIKSAELKEYCKKLGLGYYTAIRYLLSNKYLVRILRGIFYKLSVEERKFKKIDINYMEAISESLRIKNVKNWYFGLDTAIKLNKLTHEYFATDYIINDTLFRPRAIEILGHKIVFIKLKKSVFGFGITKNKINFSEIEKTLLDFVYLLKYRGLESEAIKRRVSDLAGYCSKAKLLKYSKKYNKEVRHFVMSIV